VHDALRQGRGELMAIAVLGMPSAGDSLRAVLCATAVFAIAF